MRFVSLEPSRRPTKKYVIQFEEPKKTIHFGSILGIKLPAKKYLMIVH
jgi:hypothetical protein